jgi:hypothetical protein
MVIVYLASFGFRTLQRKPWPWTSASTSSQTKERDENARPQSVCGRVSSFTRSGSDISRHTDEITLSTLQGVTIEQNSMSGE